MEAKDIYIISKEWIKKDNESKVIDCIKLMSEDLARRIDYDSDKKAIGFTEWLIQKCDFQKHGVWLYKGMEFTQKELLDIFKNDTK